MKKLMMALASACAIAFSAVAGTWFDGGIAKDWPNASTLDGGTWLNEGAGGTYADGVVTVEAETSAPLTFQATDAKEPANYTATISSKVGFTAFEELPAVPEGAKAGVISYNNLFYVLAKDPNGTTNVWTATEIAATETAADIVVTFKDATTVSYKIGENAPFDMTVASAESVQNVCLSGDGTITTLSATAEEKAVTFYITKIDNADITTVTGEGVEHIEDNQYKAKPNTELTVTYTAKFGYYFSDGQKTATGTATAGTGTVTPAVSTSIEVAAAKIGDKDYYTLPEAFTDAAAEAEIVLLKNAELDACIEIGKKLTLNIGAYNVTPKAAFTTGTTKDALFMVTYGGDLTVNGTTGTIDSSSKSISAAIKMTQKGDVYDGATRAKLTVNANLTGWYYAIVGNGGRPGTDIVVNGGTITAVNDDKYGNLAIYNPQCDSTVTINGGTLTGLDAAIEMRGGNLVVNGGTLTATTDKFTYIANGSGSTVSGAAIAISQHTTQGDIAVSAISNAVVHGVKSVAIVNPQNNKTDNVTVTLGAATYEGELFCSTNLNATVTKDGADLAAPAGFVWDGNTLKKAAAKIGDVYYITLAAANAAAVAGNTITLVENASGAGIFVEKDNLTFDFNGKTYTVTGPAVGSTGTQSQGFHIEAANCTLTNGTLTSVSGSGVKMLVQNYSNLSLVGMTLDGTQIDKAYANGDYVLSNNAGSTVIENTTITAKEGDFAFDTCKYKTYAAPTVEVKGTSVLNGNVELSGGNLTLTAGTLNGTLKDGGIGSGTVTKSADFEAAAPAGYVWKDGVLTKCAIKIGTEYYLTLTEAVQAYDGTADIVLLADLTGPAVGTYKTPAAGQIGVKDIVIDFGGFTYTVDGPLAGSTGTQTQAFHFEGGNVVLKNGTITSSTAKMLIQNYTDLTLTDLTVDGSDLLASNMQYVFSNNQGNVNLTGTTKVIGKDGFIAMDACKYKTYTAPIVTLADTVTIDGDVELSGGTLVPNNATITGTIKYYGGSYAYIGTTAYSTLADANAAAVAGETIKLMGNMSGAGIFVEKDNLTFDFNGKTYTVTGPAVGSTGTQSQGFHIETANCTLTNGTLTSVSGSGVKMLVQNYSNLSLVGMTLDGTQIDKAYANGDYVLSNNAGSTVIENTTITAKEGDFAFDTCKYKTYAAPTVEVKGTSVLNGNVELSGGNLTLTAGTLNGTLKDGGIGSGTVTKSADFEAAAPEGYEWDANGVLVKKSQGAIVIDPSTGTTNVVNYADVGTNTTAGGSVIIPEMTTQTLTQDQTTGAWTLTVNAGTATETTSTFPAYYDVTANTGYTAGTQYDVSITTNEVRNGSTIAADDVNPAIQITTGTSPEFKVNVPEAKDGLYYGLEYSDNVDFSNSTTIWQQNDTILTAPAGDTKKFYRVIIDDKAHN